VQACTRVNGCARRSAVQACGEGSTCQDGVCMVPNATQADLYFGPGTECWISTHDVLCTINICNAGSVATGPTTLKFYLDAPAFAPACSDPTLPTERPLPLSSIAAGSCYSDTFAAYEGASAGPHRVAMFLDGACNTTELDESDNYSVFTPDLVVDAPTGTPELWFDSSSQLYWNATFDSVYMQVRVCNFGGAAAGAFWVDFWADALAPAPCGQNGDDFEHFTGLAAGACTSWWTTQTVYVGTGTVEKTAQVLIDSTCAVAETSEANLWTVTYY
jgi:hypothetical protein